MRAFACGRRFVTQVTWPWNGCAAGHWKQFWRISSLWAGIQRASCYCQRRSLVKRFARVKRRDGASAKQGNHAMHPDTAMYNKSLEAEEQEICDLLAEQIDKALPEAEN